MSNAINSKSVSLASIFDPYVAGTTKARASGIDDAGNDTSNLYANIIYGSAAAATGIKSQNADLNTLYAAKGTAVYNTPLPINGNTYSGTRQVTSGTGAASIGFAISGGGSSYYVQGSTASGGTQTLATGAVPAGATQVKFTWVSSAVAPGAQGGGGGSTSNAAPSPTALPSQPVAFYNTASFGAQSSEHGTVWTLQIDFYDASGRNISTTTIYLSAIVSGSAS